MDAAAQRASYDVFDEVRKIERSVRLMAARNLAPCIRFHLLLVRPLADGAVSASTAAAVSESVDRRTSRKSSQWEELQADGGQLDIFAEDPATDLKRKSVAAAERSIGSLRGMAQSLRSTMSSTQLL
jgi:hypothetical protein